MRQRPRSELSSRGATKHLPEFKESFKPHDLKVVVGDEKENGRRGIHEVHRAGAELVAEWQWRGGKDHCHDKQSQLDDAEDKIDLGKLANKGPAESCALGKSLNGRKV